MAPAKTPTAPKPAKKGSHAKWVTGSRFGQKTHSGTVVCFVKAGETAGSRVPAAAKAFIDPAHTSNRDRYVMDLGGAFVYANAKSVI